MPASLRGARLPWIIRADRRRRREDRLPRSGQRLEVISAVSGQAIDHVEMAGSALAREDDAFGVTWTAEGLSLPSALSGLRPRAEHHFGRQLHLKNTTQIPSRARPLRLGLLFQLDLLSPPPTGPNEEGDDPTAESPKDEDPKQRVQRPIVIPAFDVAPKPVE